MSVFLIVSSLAVGVTVWFLFGRRQATVDPYVFDPTELRTLFEKVVRETPGANARARIAKLQAELHLRYDIPPQTEWIINYAYGIQCALLILYASPFEYILIWGTPSGNEGGTGRHRFVQFYDTVLSGNVLYWSEKDPLDPFEFSEGDSWVHLRGDCGGQRIVGEAWCVEYARGFLPTILPFGLASTLVTLDFTAVFRTIRAYAVLNIQHFRIGSTIRQNRAKQSALDRLLVPADDKLRRRKAHIAN